MIRLRRLSDDELFALLSRMTKLYAMYYADAPQIGEEQIATFLKAELHRAGTDEMMTPREMLRDYMTLLNVLMQNPGTDFDTLVQGTSPVSEEPKTSEEEPPRRRYEMEDLSF